MLLLFSTFKVSLEIASFKPGFWGFFFGNFSPQCICNLISGCYLQYSMQDVKKPPHKEGHHQEWHLKRLSTTEGFLSTAVFMQPKGAQFIPWLLKWSLTKCLSYTPIKFFGISWLAKNTPEYIILLPHTRSPTQLMVSVPQHCILESLHKPGSAEYLWGLERIFSE